MKVLGYNGGLDGYLAHFGTSHDAAATLVIDGEIVAAAEEERFDRRKHSGAFPLHAVRSCLEQAGLSGFEALDLICYPHAHGRMWQPEIVRENGPRMGRGARWALSGAVHGLRWAHRWLGFDDARCVRVFAAHTGYMPPESRFRVVGHHLSHAASAFFESPFERALCVTLDAQGESRSASAWLGDDRGLHLVDETFAPNSLGYLYQSMTYFLGFDRGDEYKVMGLAPYGDPSRFRSYFAHRVRSEPSGRFVVDPSWLGWLVVRDGLIRPGMGYPRSLTRALGPPRRADDPIEARHRDIAAALQEALERAVLAWLAPLSARLGTRHLCLAGGVALNCTLNGKIARSGLFDVVHVAPAAHDAGTSAGAALHGWHELARSRGLGPRRGRPRVFVGPDLGAGAVESALRGTSWALCTSRPPRLARAVARALAEGEIVGLCRGRMEWGPRALGHRSILADPRRAEMRDIVNRAVKHREGFRPFAPAVLQEEAEAWFDLSGLGSESPYMLFTVPVREHRRSQIPAVTHVDGSARVQTVRRELAPAFHELLSAFRELTGVPVLLNTSFNVRGEPIVRTPSDALRCFVGTELDLLVLGDILVEKRGARSQALARVGWYGDGASGDAARIA